MFPSFLSVKTKFRTYVSDVPADRLLRIDHPIFFSISA
jgi:hypothetical protein